MPTNPPYPSKNARSWQTSPSSLTTPPRGSGRSTSRLHLTRTRLGTHFKQVFLLHARDFVDNVFSQVRSPSVPATTTTARTVTQRLSHPVPSLAPTPNRPPSHRSHPHLSPCRPDRHPIITLPSSSWNLNSYTRLTRRGSLQVTLVLVTTWPRACTQLTTRWCLVRMIAKQTQHDKAINPWERACGATSICRYMTIEIRVHQGMSVWPSAPSVCLHTDRLCDRVSPPVRRFQALLTLAIHRAFA